MGYSSIRDTADDPEPPVGERIGLDPCASSERDGGTLRQSHCDRVGRCQVEALLGDVGEQVVGLVDLAGQPQRNRVQQHGVRPERAPTGERRDREFRICAHPRGPSTALHRTHEGQPRVDRSAAVGQRAAIACAFGGIGPALRLRRPAPKRSHQCGEHGNRRVRLDCPLRVQPAKPAFDGRGTATFVRGESTTRNKSRGPVDVAGLLRVPDRGLRLPVRLAPVGRTSEQLRHEVRLDSPELRME